MTTVQQSLPLLPRSCALRRRTRGKAAGGERIALDYTKLKQIKMEGHRKTRTLTCPYCDETVRITLVGHLKRHHPEQWDAWTAEFVRLYGELNNDLKRVMRKFTNSEGQLILSWTVIDNEIKKRVEVHKTLPTYTPKESISRWDPTPDEYDPAAFTSTVWDIKRRGSWGVHQSTYRGNWPPQLVRALLERYSAVGDFVLDPFVGGGTTLIEARVLGRPAIGFDVSEQAIALTTARLEELEQRATRESLYPLPATSVEVRRGDARLLPGIENDSVDFVCTHPPYGDALTYTHSNKADLSLISDPTEFMNQLEVAGQRFFEVLKPGAYCAILIGDLRRNGRLCTFGADIVQRFRSLGFTIEDFIVKTQHQDRSTEFYYKATTEATPQGPPRMRIAHEYLIVFKKPGPSGAD